MTNQMFLLLMYCITFSYLIFFISRYQACNVFNIVTDQDSLQREIVQPQDQSIDSGLGIWTKYDPSLKTGYRSNGMQYMHIFTQFNEVRSSQYLQYFIQFDPITDTLYHTIQLSLNQLEQYQFPIDGTQSAQKWVYFYIGFQKSTNIYTLFLYETNNQLEVQMGKGKGMYATVQAQEYFVLGSQLTTRHPFDTKIEYQYTTFRGKISDFYFLNGADAFYQDIPTFIASLDNLICPMPDLCPNGIQIIPLLVPLTTLTQSQIIMVSTSYLSSRYTISGWARIEPLLTGESYDSVLVRATLNQNYYDNSIIGDRMFFWKYKQNIQPELNGFYISTYGYEDPSLLAYSSQPDDEWLELGSFYETAITKWHYFVFEHGLTDPVQHTKLYIYFSQDKVEKTKYFLNRQQFESKSIYVSIGGDKFNQNNLLSGQVSDFVFSYCFKVDQTYTIPCYFTCEGCSGPTANDCDDCVDPTNSNRQLLPQTNQCACKENFVETPQSVGCKDSNLLFDNVIIEEFEETLICEYGEFLVQNQFCFKCPQQLQDQGFYCADCWDNPKTWYLNSVCTYDMLKYDLSTPTNFIRKTRKPMDFDFYLIDITNKQLNLCNGCLGYQTSPEQQVFQTKSLGQTVNVVCKSCFEYQDGQCVLVKSNCIECSIDVTNVRKCKECKSRSVLTDEGCQDCPSNCSNCVMKNNSIVCTICDYGYGINNGQCQQCGKFCGICQYELTYYSETYFRCQKCIDPYKYIFSMDGVSCVKQEIPNCQIGHQIRYVYQMTESSLNIYFTPSEIDDTVKNRCALCENGYTNIFEDSLCEQKGSTASQSIQINGQVISLEEDSINSFFPTNSRSQIKNCLTEIKYNSYFTCAKCAFGYYSQQVLGVCYQCPQNLYCRSCIQQNILQKNAWSQEIALYLAYNYQQGNIYATRATKTFSVYDNEIICTSCKSGYLLYEGTCIKGCEKGCQNCQIIDGKSECVQCPNTVQGQILSYENNNCLTCPYNCAYCRITSKSEINAVNSDFNPEYSNLIPYSYQCLKGFSNPDLYFDWNINLYIQCTMNKVCYKRATLPLKVYCSDTMYQADLSASSNQEEFKKHNVAMSEVFSLSQSPHFPQIENYNFYDQMNKKQIKQFVLQLSFEYSGGQDCIIPQQGFLNSTLKKNIFSLTNLELEINGDITKNLVIDEFADINGFQKITLNNIKFSNQFDYILKIKHRKGVEVLFNNILMENQIITDSKMAKILITNPQSIDLKRIQLLNCNIKDTLGLITYDFDYQYEQELIVNVEDFKIKNSKFYNTKILLINIYQLSQDQNIELSQLAIQDSYFIDSSLISNQFIQDIKISKLSTISLKRVNLNNVNSVNSQLIVLYDIKEFNLIDINISESQLSNSLYMQSNTFKILNFVLTNSILSNSRIIVNQQSSSQIYSEQINYELTNIQFTNNHYDQSSHQAFLFILKNAKQQTKVTLTNLQLSLNQLTYDHSIKYYQILSETANFYIQAEIIILTQVKIVRAMGFPEFSLLDSNSLSIQDLTSSLDSNYHIKTIHSSLQCIQQYLIEQILTTMMFFLNNKEVLLDKIYLNNLIIANQPLILFKSLDRLTQQNIETITIKNSQFDRCTLIITKVAQQQSIIYIQSEQQQVISIFNSTFTNNHQHSYVSDEAYKSSSTIQILCTLSSVYFDKLIFKNNLVTNSHSSNLVITAIKFQITNSNFENANVINYETLKDNIVWSSQDSSKVFLEHIQQMLPIYSYGGCGYINTGDIEIYNVQVVNSSSQLGGAFHIDSQSEGKIVLQNTQFKNVQSSMDYGIISQGGALFIDGSESYLQLTISNCTFSQSYSRGDGGSLYVIPSKINSKITLNSITVNECFSLNSGFLKIIKSTSTTATISAYLTNITINNTLNGIQHYLGRIIELTQVELRSQQQNYLFFIETGKIYINQVSIVSSIISGIIYLQDQTDIQINDLQVSNAQLGSQSLTALKLTKLSTATMILNNVIFKNITQFIPIQTTNCDYAKINQIEYACLLEVVAPLKIESYYSTPIYNLIAQCHLSDLFILQLEKQSILSIFSIKSTHQLQIQNIQLSDIQCSNCTTGLMNLSSIEKITNKTLVSIKSLSLQNNICGKTGCLVISQSETNLYQLPTFVTNQNKTRRLSINQKDKFDLKYSVQITKSYFKSNYATYGAGILLLQVDALIDQCQFLSNEASQAGGAIFYQGSKDATFSLYNTEITGNKASVGGAVYILDYIFNDPKQLDLLLIGNSASNFGSNLVGYPSKLGVSLNGGLDQLNISRQIENSTQILDLVSITPYIQYNETLKFVMLPTGQSIKSYKLYSEKFQDYISANLTLRIIPLNAQGQQMKNLENTKCQISSRINDIDQLIGSGDFGNQYTNINEVIFNSTSRDYNFDSLIVKFNPKLRNSKILQLKFTCDSVKIPVFSSESPYLLESYFENYTLLMNVQTYNCQRGEYYQLDEGTCLVCDSSQDQFTVIAGQKCSIKDQVTTEAVTSVRLKLRPTYWRPYEISTKIEYCRNMPENCEGGWNPGNPSCFEGHIGALCEQCDIYNIQGKGAYSISTIYKCGACSGVGDNLTKVILISLWTLISIMLSVNGTLDSIDQALLAKKMNKIGVSVNARSGIGGILIKVLTNYFQILGTIATFQMQLPTALTSTVSSVGSPLEAMSYSLDCFLVILAQRVDIEMIYFRIIWGLMMPMMYIIVFLILYGIAALVKQARRSMSVITTTFIYMYIFLQPTLIGGFVALLSFRQISDVTWIQGNVAYKYNTPQHIKWLVGFILPSLGTIVVLIPLFMFWSLYKIRNDLEETKNRRNWGYLYNEYRQKAYFWELVKIQQKSLIIIFLTFYEDLIVIKAAMIFIIVFMYKMLSKKYQPYEISTLNEYDDESSLICSLSIVLGITIYSATLTGNQEIVWPFYIILLVINGLFIFKLGIQILFAQLENQQDKLDKLRDKVNKRFPNLQYSNPFFRYLLTNRNEQSKRVKLRFKKIKEYLFKIAREIIQLKIGLQFDKVNDPKQQSDSMSSEFLKKNPQIYPEIIGGELEIFNEDNSQRGSRIGRSSFWNQQQTKIVKKGLKSDQLPDSDQDLDKQFKESEILRLQTDANQQILDPVKESPQKSPNSSI